jgi:hypothetical protein
MEVVFKCGVKGGCPLPSHTVQSPQNIIAGSYMVMLIDKDQHYWKTRLVRDIFAQEEAEVILNIALSPLHPPNRLIWKGTKDGIFSIRGAYLLGVEL